MPFALARLGRYELRRFRGLLPRLALVFVVLVPLLYGAIYLSANWDPYGKLDNLQVAVVNNDQPTEFNGDRVAAGEDLVQNLKDNPTFDWQFVDATTADEGLRAGTYYMIITIDPDFSASLVSGAGDDPRRAKVFLRRDDANGFVIGSITAKAEDTIVRQVDAAAQESYFKAVFANLALIRDNLMQAKDGAGQLADGLGTAQKGSSALADGTKQASAGAQQLAAGTSSAKQASGQLATGAGQVADGTQQLNDTVSPVLTLLTQYLPGLQTDAKSLSSSATDLTAKVAGRTNSIASDVTQAQAAMSQLEKDNPDLAQDPQWQKLKERLATAQTRTSEVATTTKDIADATKAIDTRVQQSSDLTTKVKQAQQNVTKLNNGAHQVADGARQLNNGLGTIDDGAQKLAKGTSDLQSGAAQLDSGLSTLHKGAVTLRDALSDGVQRIPVLSADEQSDAIQVLSSPAEVEATIDHPAGVYGRGLAPMFFSIALWVFGISVFLVVRPITGRTLAGRASALRMAITAWLPIAALAVIGGLIMVGTVWLTLGLDPVNAPAFLGLTVLGALCFSAIAHFLRTALGTPGSSILLVWLILQLASTGGTYPAPVLPPFFATIGQFMPMTYLIDAFRVTISGGQTTHLVRDILVLAAISVTTLALTTLVVARRRGFAMKDLHPPLVAP